MSTNVAKADLPWKLKHEIMSPERGGYNYAAKGKRGTLIRCWWECKLVQPLWKTVWTFLKKLKIELPYNPATALLGIYPKDTDIVKCRDTCAPMFISAMSTIAKWWWKGPQCPSIDEWIKEMWCIYNGILLNH